MAAAGCQRRDDGIEVGFGGSNGSKPSFFIILHGSGVQGYKIITFFDIEQGERQILFPLNIFWFNVGQV